MNIQSNDFTKMITPVVNNETTILWNLPAGKPDTSEPLEDPYLDLRTRVLQKSQKGETCLYYAMTRLRPKYGKNCGNFTKEREFEVTFSNHRKDLTDFSFMLWKLTQLFIWIKNLKKENKSLTTDNISSFINSYINKVDNKTIAEAIKNRCLFFLENCPNFLELTETDLEDKINFFLAQEKKVRRNWLSYKLIHETKYTREYAHSDTKKEEIITPQSTQLKSLLLAKFLENPEKDWNNLSYITTIICLGFRHCKWEKSEATIDTLIDRLRSHGPLLGVGMNGIPYYKCQPCPAKKIENIDIPLWGWARGSRKEETEIENSDAHVITILGAEKRINQNVVFFIDPFDPSDPSHLLRQRIFAISFNTFASNLNNLMFQSRLPNYLPIENL